MKLVPPVDPTCMLGDELIASCHGVAITAAGITPNVRCGPECHAMFCDFRTALQLAPLSFAASQTRMGWSVRVARREVARCGDQESARFQAITPL